LVYTLYWKDLLIHVSVSVSDWPGSLRAFLVGNLHSHPRVLTCCFVVFIMSGLLNVRCLSL
jgi:hypothetical protein